MTTLTDIANRSLQVPGTRTTVTDAELAGNETNEAIQINLIIQNIRKRLIRMAPWNFSLKTSNLVYITSAPGTPENTSAPTTLWQPGQPTPPWAYEYQYPIDCLRACFIIPSTQTGFAGGIPITTAVTGGAASFWQGPPVKYKIQNDQFFTITAVTGIVTAGSGYAIGDIITLFTPDNTQPPIGAPAQILVTNTGFGGSVTAAVPINSIIDNASINAGAYFAPQPNPQAQGSTTGAGTGASFNVTFTATASSQRVILTNQEFATLTYCQDISDPNIMDDMFQDAWAKILGATITIPLTGDKKLANLAIQQANAIIQEARVGDGNEGFTVNDVTPDWIRIRGIDFAEPYSGPYTGFDWGGLWPIFG